MRLKWREGEGGKGRGEERSGGERKAKMLARLPG